MYINLSTAKQHLNIDSSYTEEDSYIQQLIDVAEDVVCQSINSDTLLLLTVTTGDTINQIEQLINDSEDVTYQLINSDTLLITSTGASETINQIKQLIEVAQDVTYQLINSEVLLVVRTSTGTTGDTINQIPKSLQQAILLMVGQFYANREPVAFAAVNKVPLAFDYLISLYRKY